MTHSLAIPEANKSPYPLQEPPHVHQEPVKVAKHQADKKAKKNKKNDGNAEAGGVSGTLVVIGAALGLGALALAATLIDRRQKPAKPTKRGKTRKS